MTDTLDKKKSQGQLFQSVLDAAQGNKDFIFKALDAALEKTNPTPSKPVNREAILNGMTGIEVVAAVKETTAKMKAKDGAFLFAEDYAYLAADAYKRAGHGDIADFKRDFRAHATESAARQMMAEKTAKVQGG